MGSKHFVCESVCWVLIIVNSAAEKALYLVIQEKGCCRRRNLNYSYTLTGEIEKSETWMCSSFSFFIWLQKACLTKVLHICQSKTGKPVAYMWVLSLKAESWVFYSSMNTWIEKSRKDFIISTNHVEKNVSVIIDILNFI